MSKQKRKNKYFGEGLECSPGDLCACSPQTLLPKGIERIDELAICAERLMPEDGGKLGMHDGKAQVAVFDFDGTCLSGSSPKRLFMALSRHAFISPYKMIRIGLWGLAYKMNLPKDPQGVRERVFSAFKGFSALKVNTYLCKLYQSRINKLFRKEADAEMIAHLEEGHSIVLVSASFEPIVASAMLSHPIPISIASRMKIDENGNYTGEVDGLPTEGTDKVVVLTRFLDDYYGKGNWEIGWAYGDHYSDVSMLDSARHPFAVTPDARLKRYAVAKGWKILDWE